MTALSLVLVGLALLLLHRRSGAKAGQLLCLAALVLSLLALTGYVLGVEDLYRVAVYSAMALHAALAFCILGVGVIWASASTGFAALRFPAGNSVTGKLIRLLLPGAIILPVALGWLWLEGIRRGVYGAEFGVAMFAVSLMVVVVTGVLLTARALEHESLARQRARSAEQQQEAVFRQLFESMPDAVIAADRAGVMVRVNSQAERVFGYGRAEMLGQPVEMLLPLRLRAAHVGMRANYMAAPAVRSVGERPDLYGRRKDGSEFSVEINLSPLQIGEGLLVVSTVRDVTERKQAERRIRGQLEHLNLLDQITRSIGERQDLKSIFQIVVRSLEDSLPIDFGCVCLYDAPANALTVMSVGVKSEAIARALTMDEKTVIGVDDNGLSRCVQGQLVYESDIGVVPFPFPERLARGGWVRW